MIRPPNKKVIGQRTPLFADHDRAALLLSKNRLNPFQKHIYMFKDNINMICIL